MPFDLFIDGENLLLQAMHKQPSSFNLHQIHIRSCDSPSEKVGDPAHLNFCAFIEVKKNRRYIKLFFVSFQAMDTFVNTVLEAQGFSSRLQQYDYVSNLPQTLLC